MKKYVLSALILLLSSCSVKYQQGIPVTDWQHYAAAEIQFDANGIPTLQANNWDQLIETQGFLTASERFWQMDLMRKAAVGRLSEWFGKPTLKYDIKKASEDWLSIAKREYNHLPPDEKHYLDLYSQGINQFLKQYPGRWGYEYFILGTDPEPWNGYDSLLIIMSMAHTLSNNAPKEVYQTQWKKQLDDDWKAFLFPRNHPWNHPLFGEAGPAIQIPPQNKWLPPSTPDNIKHSANLMVDPVFGSNNWAIRLHDQYFLANDPHLGYTVPMLWYPMRMRISADEWVVGVTIPGIPGIILGMNQSLAWAFTNAREDVDDYLTETISADGNRYVSHYKNKQPVWQNIIRKKHTIHIRHHEPHTTIIQSTHRGPLTQLNKNPISMASHQWLALKPGMLRLATIAVNQAKNWQQMNLALDRLKSPAQNVLVMDKKGNIGYRASGTGVIRKMSGRIVQNAVDGEWLGFENTAQRHRLWKPNNKKAPARQYIATANERIWTDTYGHAWASDERKARIEEYLENLQTLDIESMKKLQLDTKNLFYRQLIQWFAQHAKPNNPDAKTLVDQWRQWDGFAESNPQVFNDAIHIENLLNKLLITKARQHLLAKNDTTLYTSTMSSGWLLTLLKSPIGFEVFGFNNQVLANHLLTEIKHKRTSTPYDYQQNNTWQTQHVFANAIPFVGKEFAIEALPQKGYSGLVRKERGLYGSTVRLLWDLKNPQNSLWSIAVGQSGHVGSPYYKHFHRPWVEGKYIKIFDAQYQWNQH